MAQKILGHYPDVEAALERLDAEDPPAHIRAQRLAELHLEIADVNYALLKDLAERLDGQRTDSEKLLATLHKAQETQTAKVQRSTQEFQEAVRRQGEQVLEEVAWIRHELRTRHQWTTAHLLGATGAGAVSGILLLAALWLGLGQTMRVQVIPPPQVHDQQKGR
jgi:hypothetical protein